MRASILPAYLFRAAGFAYRRLDALRCTHAAGAVDVIEAAAAARIAVGQAFDQAVAQERYASNPAFDDPAVRKQLSRHVKRARAFARELVDTEAPAESLREIARALPAIAGLGAELGERHAVWRSALRKFSTVFAEDFERARAALRALYRDDERLVESVFLESPEAFQRIRQLIATDGPRNARARQRERLGVLYAQRFCAKNDTNSICGPHGVAYIGNRGKTAQLEIIGEDPRRETYFSHWAAEALLAEAVRRAGDAARVTWRLQPSARVEPSAVSWCAMDHDATTTFRRRYARSALPPPAVRLLQAMARPRTREDLAALGPELELTADEIASFVDELVAAGVVLRGPTLPPGLFRPLRAVAAELETWPASEARTWALGEVAAFEELVAAFARAPLERRLELHEQLVARFGAATGSAAQRGEGLHYADRSLLHEDACVEVRAELGPVHETLVERFPILISAVQLTLELARERVREWFAARFGAGTRVPAIEAHRAFDADVVLATPAATPRAAALRSAIERVRDVIARAAGAAEGGTVRIATADLAAALGELAAPTRPGYVSADVMLRRLADGGTEAVLGEVHGFFWLPTCLLDVLPDEHRIRVVEMMRDGVRAMAAGQPTAECVFLHTQATDRRFPIATTDLELMTSSDRPDALELGALDLRLGDDGIEFLHGETEVVPLVAYTRYPFILYTSRIAPLFDDYAERFPPESLLPPALRERDAPRLALDDIVFQRRAWRRPVAQVRAVLAATSEADLFRAGQALRRELGCGTRVFVSVPGEPKPVLLDFHDVFLLEALVNLLERQPDDASVRFSEMLPDPDELVARGPDGLRTSELRIGFYRS